MLDGVCRLHVDVAYVVGCGALVGGWVVLIGGASMMKHHIFLSFFFFLILLYVIDIHDINLFLGFRTQGDFRWYVGCQSRLFPSKQIHFIFFSIHLLSHPPFSPFIFCNAF